MRAESIQGGGGWRVMDSVRPCKDYGFYSEKAGKP